MAFDFQEEKMNLFSAGDFVIFSVFILHSMQLIDLTAGEIPLSVWISLSNVTSTELFISRFLRDKPATQKDEAKNEVGPQTKLPTHPKLPIESQQLQQRPVQQHKPAPAFAFPFWHPASASTSSSYSGAGRYFPGDAGWSFASNGFFGGPGISSSSATSIEEHIGVGIKTRVFSEQKVQNKLTPLSKSTQALMMSNLAQPSQGCRPSPTCVQLAPPNRDPDVIFWPITTEVDRCAGCCNHESLHCVAKDWDLRKIKAIKARYSNDNRDLFIFEGEVDLEVVRHKKCACECRVKASACNPNQIYVPDKCACECKRTPATRFCRSKQIWDSKVCACRCASRTRCTNDESWDEDRCACRRRCDCENGIFTSYNAYLGCRCSSMRNRRPIYGRFRSPLSGGATSRFPVGGAHFPRGAIFSRGVLPPGVVYSSAIADDDNDVDFVSTATRNDDPGGRSRKLGINDDDSQETTTTGTSMTTTTTTTTTPKQERITETFPRAMKRERNVGYGLY